MKRFLLPLLAVLALPTAVNATNYLECEAILQVVNRQAERLLRGYSPSMEDYKIEDQKIFDRAMKDAKKRGCYYIK